MVIETRRKNQQVTISLQWRVAPGRYLTCKSKLNRRLGEPNPNFVDLIPYLQTLGTWNDAVGEPLKLFVDKIFRPGRPDGTAGPRQYLQIQNGTNITIIASPTGATESDLSSDMENPPTAAPADTFTDQEKVGDTYFSFPKWCTWYELFLQGGGKGQGSAGKIAAIVVPLGIVTAVLAVLYVMYLRRQQQKTSEFVRLVF